MNLPSSLLRGSTELNVVLISGEDLKILRRAYVVQIESAIFTADLGNHFMSCEKVHANHAILDLLAPAY